MCVRCSRQQILTDVAPRSTIEGLRIEPLGNSMEHSGGCMCGAAKFTGKGEPLRVTVCHCAWCQRRTGSAYGIEVVYDASSVDLTGSSIASYRHISDQSGRWLDVSFCNRCGTNLGFTLEAASGLRTLLAGAFDDPSWVRADKYKFRHVYNRSRRTWSDQTSDVEIFEQHFRK